MGFREALPPFFRCTRAHRLDPETREWVQHLHRVWAAILTFWAYASLHLTRETLAKVKSDLQAEWSGHRGLEGEMYFGPDAAEDTKRFLGTLDAVFMWSYAVGLMFLGDLGDRFSLRWILGGAMIGSGILTAVFGVGGYDHLVQSPWFYAVFWGLNGLVQSLCWPAVVAVMGHWWGKGVRGAVMGLWSGNASAGNAIAGPITSPFVGVGGIGWAYAMMTSGGILFFSGWLVLFALIPRPVDLGFDRVVVVAEDGHSREAQLVAASPGIPVDEGADFGRTRLLDGENEDEDDELLGEDSKGEAVGIWKALCIPGALTFALCYACLKAVNYCMFFWLADYISNYLGWPARTADLYSAMYDVGGIAGGFLAGASTDFVSRRSPVVFGALIASVPLLIVFGLPNHSHAVVATLCIILGMLIGGAANLISSVFAVEIGEQAMADGKTVALATVTGLIDGIASLGAGAALYVIGDIPWSDVSYLLAPLAFLSALCLAPVTYKDIRHMCRRTTPEQQQESIN